MAKAKVTVEDAVQVNPYPAGSPRPRPQIIRWWSAQHEAANPGGCPYGYPQPTAKLSQETR